ncbi:hypothetical protein [Roseovarius nubinhibens]|nr:hypothetical protein [Roseovarius nubinhibens]|tara:strand:+ start:942 stop:1112 length:171 start_codon:yes stop_codon:yes gene_type:complete
MGLGRDHEMHKRRFSRNLGLGLVLGGFVALIFGLTIAKVTNEDFSVPNSEKIERTE